MRDLDEILNIDTVFTTFGVKFVFVESGELAIRDKCTEVGVSYSPDKLFWCELSWGAGGLMGDKYDFAFNDFGKSLGEAMRNCLKAFLACQDPEVLRAKKEFGLPEFLETKINSA